MSNNKSDKDLMDKLTKGALPIDEALFLVGNLESIDRYRKQSGGALAQHPHFSAGLLLWCFGLLFGAGIICVFPGLLDSGVFMFLAKVYTYSGACAMAGFFIIHVAGSIIEKIVWLINTLLNK